MSNRVYYLRDKTNICQKADGSFTRGNPVACVMTTVDRVCGNIKYAVSAVHPKYNFDRALARTIAAGRLEVKPIIIPLQGDRDPVSKKVIANSHAITKSVMQHIYEANSRDMKGESSVLRQRSFEWLERAALPKVVPVTKIDLNTTLATRLASPRPEPIATHGYNTGT